VYLGCAGTRARPQGREDLQPFRLAGRHRPCGSVLAVPDLAALGTGLHPVAIPANPQAPLWRPSGQDSPPPHRNSARRAAAFSYAAQQRDGPLKGRRPTAVSFQEVTVNREMSSLPQGRTDSGGCPAGGFGRRSVLQGVAVTGLAAVGGNLLGRDAHSNDRTVETAATGSAYPFYGEYQSGIITPPPDSRQPFSTYAGSTRRSTRRPPPGWPGHERNKPPAFAWAN
jgi:hypothetical protein